MAFMIWFWSFVEVMPAEESAVLIAVIWSLEKKVVGANVGWLLTSVRISAWVTEEVDELLDGMTLTRSGSDLANPSLVAKRPKPTRFT
ncbi:MAG: hypothetical protein Fur0034_18150 [Desulfuromonadia bacterium]